MPNVVVTSTANSIKVDFGDYAAAVGFKKGCWSKGSIVNFELASGNEYVTALSLGGPRWNLVYQASGVNLIVDTVAGVAPTSNDDLYTKLIALIA